MMFDKTITRIQLAGIILLALAAPKILAVTVGLSSPSYDLGFLMLLWLGIGLVRNKGAYRDGAMIVCGFYMLVGLIGVLIGAFLNSPAFTTIGDYVRWVIHYALFFGIPFHLLWKNPKGAVRLQLSTA
ncbi:MAG: hypothetical protein AB1705_04750 [Verrucomicrobiota bacterium]